MIELPRDFEGDIIKPGDARYDDASTVLVAKGAPVAVLRPRTPAAMGEALKYAASTQQVVSVRSGGHSNAGFGTNKGGLVIDLHYFTAVELIDPQKRLVRVGAGATWEQVAAVLAPHGLAISSGDTKTVGVGGLIAGGGIGWMVRKFGLAIDNVVAAEVVTVDGVVHHTSQTENPDLFWAVRGGGGNIGVVTSVDIIADPISDVLWGTITYDFNDLKSVLKGWRDAVRTGPDELTTMLIVFPTAFGPMQPSVMVMVCYASSDEAAARKAVEPLRHLAQKPVHEELSMQPYPAVLGDAHLPPNTRVITHNMFVRDFSDELIETICQQKSQILQIRQVGGAMNTVAADATAFAHRDSEALIVAPTFVAPDASQEQVDTALAAWRAIEPFGNGGYIGFFSDITPKVVASVYPDATYHRLAHIKATYDPHNVLSQNVNVEPA